MTDRQLALFTDAILFKSNCHLDMSSCYFIDKCVTIVSVHLKVSISVSRMGPDLHDDVSPCLLIAEHRDI